jgi:biotin carboxyl carrier protein
MVSSQVQDYVYGLYGRPPASMDPEVVRKVLQGYARGEQQMTMRPADVLEPEMENARREVADLAQDDGDVLIYALYPTTGLRFLRWKYGLEAPPPELLQGQPPTPSPAHVPAPPAPAPAAGQSLSAQARTYNVYVQGQQFQVTVDPANVKRGDALHSGLPGVATAARSRSVQAEPATGAQEARLLKASRGEVLLTAPMPGLVIRYEVAPGQPVKKGDAVVIVESMKMQNALRAPADGVVTHLPQEVGARVPKGTILAILGPKDDGIGAV